MFDHRVQELRRQRWLTSELPALHQHAGEVFFDRLNDFRQPFPRIVVISPLLPWCQSGLSRLLTATAGQKFQSLVFLTSPHDPAVAQLATQAGPTLWLSYMACHACPDLPDYLTGLYGLMSPQDMIIGAAWGADTLSGLDQAFIAAELAHQHQPSARIHPRLRCGDFQQLLARSGFSESITDVERLTFSYQNPFQLFEDLRAAGESNSLNSRKKTLTSRQIFAHVLAHLPCPLTIALTMIIFHAAKRG